MDAASGAVAGGVVAVALGAFRLLEAVLVKRNIKAGNGTLAENARSAAEKAREAAEKAKEAADLAARNHRVLTKEDEDGGLRIYQPKWVGTLLRRHHELTRQQADISQRQTALLEQLAAGLQAHWDREEKELVGIKDVLRDFRS